MVLTRALFFGLCLFPVVVLAQVFGPEQMPQVANPQDLEMLVRSIGGESSLRTLALVALGVQALMFLLSKTAFMDKFAGKYKLALVYGLNIAAGVLTLKIMGLDTPAALVHANSLASYQVFFHQVYKQVSDRGDS